MFLRILQLYDGLVTRFCRSTIVIIGRSICIGIRSGHCKCGKFMVFKQIEHSYLLIFD